MTSKQQHELSDGVHNAHIDMSGLAILGGRAQPAPGHHQMVQLSKPAQADVSAVREASVT